MFIDEEGTQTEDTNEGNANTGDEGNDPDLAEVTKRGAKNVLEENRRKSQELKELKERLAVLDKPKEPEIKNESNSEKYPRHIEDFKQKSIKAGVNAEWIESMCDVMLRTSVEAAEARASHHVGEFSKTTSRMVEKYQREQLNDAVSDLAKDKKYKYVVEKYGNQIKQKIKEQFKPEFFDNEEVLKSVAGQVMIENMSEPDNGGFVSESVNENSPSGSTSQKGSVNDDALSQFADEIGVDIRNPEMRKKVKDAYLAREASRKTKEK